MTLIESEPADGHIPYRSSIAFGLPHSSTAHPGDAAFNGTLLEHYQREEAVALDAAIALKDRARKAPLEDFWTIVAEGLASILGSQIAFVSQRLYYDEKTSTSLPTIGEPDSCLSALAWYYNDGHGAKEVGSNIRYYAWACPCAAMKYGKVFLIPSKVNDFAPENPNSMFMALGIDAYLGLPLFFDGECHAHFGLAWNEEGSRNRKLSWALIESICHSFEDLISQRIVEGAAVKSAAGNLDISQLPADYETAPAFRSFKPPVHILSHELRTPMQGVVGMLDIMHDIVQEAVEVQQNSKARDIFKGLKNDIETIQDSSKRAVDAADNVVQAYELEEQMDTKTSTVRTDSPMNTPDTLNPDSPARRPSISSAGSKRKSSVGTESSPRPSKMRLADSKALRPPFSPAPPASPSSRESEPEPALTTSEVRPLFERVVADSLKIYGRPKEVSWGGIEHGQRCHATYPDSHGDKKLKIIEWTVHPAVPQHISTERDLVKLISCVLQNAVKFTHDAMISMRAVLGSAKEAVLITVRDNGPGVEPSFRPRVFEAFSRQDNSVTRQTEGLGLGLAVAKGIAEKLGGSLQLEWTETSGPERGTTFQISLPLDRQSFAAPPTPPLVPRPRTRTMLTSYPPKARPKVRDIAKTHPMVFLVCDDNNIIRSLLVNMLVKLGYQASTQIYEACDGVEAVKRATELFQAARLTATQSPIDVILLDLMMPRLSGYDASKYILDLCKSEYTELHAPIIMAVSADVTADSKSRAKASGMTNFVTKPLSLKDLAILVEDAWQARMQTAIAIREDDP